MILSACYKEFNIKFPQGLNYCEDFYVNTCLLQRIHKVAYLPMAFYHYDQYSNNQAETRRRDPDHIQETRTKIVMALRDAVGVEFRNWQYYTFEVEKAYQLLSISRIDTKYFRSLFQNVPISVLFHRRQHHLHIIFVLSVLYLHLPICVARWYEMIVRNIRKGIRNYFCR